MLKENFVEWLHESIKNHWSMPAFSDLNEPAVTYGQVAQKIKWCHHLYEKADIKRGDKITLLGRNSVNWAIIYLATVTYGAVIVPILPDFHPADYHHIIKNSDSVLVFAADNLFDKLEETRLPEVEAILSLKDFHLLYSRKKNFSKIIQKAEESFLKHYGGSLSPDSFTFEPSRNDELAAILYTSGTSGFSKGAMLQHNCLISNVRFAKNNIDLRSGDRILSFLPAAHAFGCAFDVLFPFSIGCHVTFLGQMPSPKVLIQAMEQVRPRLILSVPLLIEKIYKKNIKPKLDKPAVKVMSKIPGLNSIIYKKIRTKLVELFGGNFIEIVIGGAALNEEVEAFLTKIDFPFTIGYGMTECGPLISYIPYPKNRKTAVGKVIDTLDVRIDSSVTGATDGTGEIQVRGENVMIGYYKNPEATKEAIDENKWLHTGDIGEIDSDGFIYIRGRHKSMLLGPSGQNIYPEEIEAILNNMPYVEESLVIEKDKKIIALVYPSMEKVDAEGLKESELIEKMEENRVVLNEQLPVYSRVVKIELYPSEFEKTPTKKIKRFLYTISQG